MNARIIHLGVVACIGLAGWAAVGGDDDKQVVDIKLCVLQLEQDDAGALLDLRPVTKVSASGDVTLQIGLEMRPPVMAISAADFRMEREGHVLRFVDGDLKFQSPGGEQPAPWTLITAPRLMVLVGQQASMMVGQEVPYMVRRADGSLVVEQSDANVEGLRFDLRVSAADERSVTFDEIRLKISRVTGRQPIPGVPFEVGRPILNSRETSMSLKLALDHVGVIRIPREDSAEPPMLLLVTVSLGKLD